MVVAAEELRLVVAESGQRNENLRGTLNSIYRFLGLCPHEVIPAHAVHETETTISDSHSLNSTMRALLEQFYSPYNEGRPFGYTSRILYN